MAARRKRQRAARSSITWPDLLRTPDVVTGELVSKHSALVRRFYVREARSCVIWLRAEQFHCLNLIAIEADDREPPA